MTTNNHNTNGGDAENSTGNSTGNSVETDGILDIDFIPVDDIPEGVDLVRRLRTLNSGHLEVPWMWSLVLGGEEDVTDPDLVNFGIGVNGATGALHWATNAGESLVPAEGTNTDRVLYRLAGLHDSYMPPGAEVPVETVYAAVREFLTTRQLPTCVHWRPAPTPTADSDPLTGPEPDTP